MQNKKNIAMEWFDRGKHDVKAAKILFEEGEYTDSLSSLIQQAVEKYLKGFLIFKGWNLRKIHDIEELITEALRYDPSLGKYLDFARNLTAYYMEDRYPPGPVTDYSEEEMKQSIDKAEELIKKILKEMD